MSATIVRGGFQVLVAAAGWLVWGLCFVVLYSVQGLVCHTGLRFGAFAGLNGLSFLLALLWVAHLAVIAALEWRVRQQSRRRPPEQGADVLLLRVTGMANVTAFLGTIAIGFPVLLLPPCA